MKGQHSNMGRFIVIVLDGFGVGAMDDVSTVRPQDVGSNTFASILRDHPDIYLPNLEKLGLMNACNIPSIRMKPQENVTFATSNLMHMGADTFFGHQEIMGTKPVPPFGEAFKNHIDKVSKLLSSHGYNVQRFKVENESYLLVENAMCIGDNIECDLSQAYNITVATDLIDFSKAVNIAKLVREIVFVPRVIVFGGSGVGLKDLHSAAVEKGDFVGINAPKSGVYNKNYQCLHLGYGVNSEEQVQSILGKNGIPVYLLGKVADVVHNSYGTSYSIVPTKEVLTKTLEIVKKENTAFICANVQETDLSGHAQDSDKYKKILETADSGIGEIVAAMNDSDILIVMADHGNDPNVGHPRHTRERVPILVKTSRNLGYLGRRETLSDVAATAAMFFGMESPPNGTSMF